MNDRDPAACCGCTSRGGHQGRRVVLTGGPGAGKTAVLEVVRRHLCEHVVVLPEAAGILFRGGFPRRRSVASRRATQLAIFHVQDQLERAALAEGDAALIVCDRGVLDGLAYWPGEEGQFFDAVGGTRAGMYARYAAVIHIRTAAEGDPSDEAAAVDRRLLSAWGEHPRRLVVEAGTDFLGTLRRTLAFVRSEVPPCCQTADTR